MKLFKNTLLIGGLAALASTMSAESLVTFTAPFSFVAGGKVLPAGKYTVAEPASHGVLLLRGTEPNSAAMVLVTESPATKTHDAVTFNRRGSAVVLSTVTVASGSTFSLFSPESKNSAAVKVALPRK
jgi:hypothetical protein